MPNNQEIFDWTLFRQVIGLAVFQKEKPPFTAVSLLI